MIPATAVCHGAGGAVAATATTATTCFRSRHRCWYRTRGPALPHWHTPTHTGFNIVFTIELVTRLAISTSMADLLSNVYLYFDFFAVVPFWIELFPVVAKGGGDSLNIMKALRILRLLKLARQFQGSVILAKAIQLSLQALMVPLFFLLLACLLFASFIYYLELEAVEGDDGSLMREPAFNSIPHALYVPPTPVLAQPV